MVIFFNRVTVDSGGRSRTDSKYTKNLQDLGIFSYICTNSKEQLGSQYLNSREDGTSLYYNRVTLCGGFKVDVTQYANYQNNSASFLDVSTIDLSLYIYGSVICGDMKHMGRAVLVLYPLINIIQK